MSKIVDAVLGHAIGDAMGMATEFKMRYKLQDHPVTEMIYSSWFNQPAGSWTDDTSMEVATIESMISNNGFNYDDIMKRWNDWINNGKYTPNGITFDVGRTCLEACHNFAHGTSPLKCGLDNYHSNGNGSLMRILPVGIYSYINDLNKKEIQKLSDEVSSLTHGHDISKMACYMYTNFVINLLKGMSKEECYEYMRRDNYDMYDSEFFHVYDRLLINDIRDLELDDIRSSGYVVDTWECVLWILLNSNSFEEVIIKTTNIGEDTDTIGAIAGSLAGIIYGLDNAPKQWLDTLKRKDYLISLAKGLENLKITHKNIEFKEISKKEFDQLDENDVMFITIPGRMGDENGSSFIIKKDNTYYFYRASGWMYPGKCNISLGKFGNKFTLWREVWEDEKHNSNKYKYIYEGFGNALCIDKTIYDEYYPYIKDEKGSEIFGNWDQAVIKMCEDKNIEIK